jgi:hypothetical protein
MRVIFVPRATYEFQGRSIVTLRETEHVLMCCDLNDKKADNQCLVESSNTLLIALQHT